MIHFQARSYDWDVYDELPWEQTGSDVTVERRLIESCILETCATLIWFWSDTSRLVAKKNRV